MLLLQHATRLVRHAADLEEEAKRSEAKAFYLAKEAEHLQGGAGVVGMDIVMVGRRQACKPLLLLLCWYPVHSKLSGGI